MKSRLAKENLVYHLNRARENLELVDDWYIDDREFKAVEVALNMALKKAMGWRQDILLAELPIKKDGC